MSSGSTTPEPRTLQVRAGSVPMMTIERALAVEDLLVIDLRSPAEFAVDHLPGAHNVPLFGDVDRALIGLLYKQFSPSAAFAEGRAALAGRIEELTAEIAELVGWELPRADLRARLLAATEDGIEKLESALEAQVTQSPPARPVLLHCWRGGLRSRSVVSFLRGLGLDRAIGLTSGYKAWRRHALDTISAFDVEGPPRTPAFVLRGLTGVGKTLVLRELERQCPGWTFDLEAQAGHRSSLLGMVGLEPVSQKGFETRIAQRLLAGFPGPVVFEGESRKVGDVVIPAPVWSAMKGALSIELTAPTDVRVRVLSDDYMADESSWPKLREQLAAVEARMERRAPLVQLFDERRTDELVEVLLERYYDPLYRHSESKYSYSTSIDSSDPERAAREIAEWIRRRPRSST